MRKFENCSKATQRKRIIEDAIVQVKRRKFVATRGAYLEFRGQNIGSGISLQTILGDKPCDCCAKGAIFASCIMSVNKVYGGDEYNQEGFIKTKLIPWFSSLELDMIETAFEKRVVEDATDSLREGYDEDNNDIFTDLGIACIAFGERYKKDSTRMLGILKNILKNRTFKP